MKIGRKLFLTTALSALLGMGVFAGVSSAKPVEKAEAVENWYYRGSGKGINWGNGNDNYVLHNVDFDASGVGWSFDANEKFVFCSTKDGWNKYNISGFRGNAAGAFAGSGTNDLTCNYAGTYNLSLSGGYLYVDFADNTSFYYVGTDTTKQSTQWTNYTSKPILLNGSAVTFSFKSNEEFKFRALSNWDCGGVGYNDLKDGDTYYGALGNNGENVKCKVAADYTVKLETSGHSIKAVIKGANSFTIYVLDLHGDLLNNSHKAYVFNGNDGNNTWPGENMTKVAGTSNMYSFMMWEKLSLIINQVGDSDKSGQTINLTPQGGKCLLLKHDTDGSLKWNSNTWVDPDTAKFIDSYMKFETVTDFEDQGTGKCTSQGWYTAAKDAYEAASFASHRQELCTISYVVARLQKWAVANGGSFTISNNVGSFSAYRNNNVITEGSNGTIITVTVCMVALASIGGYFLFKKKHQ